MRFICIYTCIVTALGFSVDLFSTIRAEGILMVETGDQKSASWIFVEELSRLWQIRNPDEDIVFAPRSEKDLSVRFDRLRVGHSRFVIAPLNSVSEDILSTGELKIAIVLWRIYLVPLVMNMDIESITLSDPDHWFVPYDSSIIPTYLEQFKPNLLLFPLTETVETGVVFDLYAFNQQSIEENHQIESQPDSSETESEFQIVPFVVVESTTDTEEDMFTYSEEEMSDDALTENEFTLESEQLNEELRDIETLPASSQILSTVKTEGPYKIQEFALMHPDGAVLYEMLGPLPNLTRSLHPPFEVVNLADDLISELTLNLPWVKEVRFLNSRLKTVGFQMAVFVQSKEDTEFIENFINLLRHPPKSNFGSSYVMQNLTTSSTRDLSPFVLHPGTLKYFNLD